MDTYILMVFLWVVGWIYCCGLHTGLSLKNAPIKVGLPMAFVVLFFVWPFVLGYFKDY